MASHHTEGRCSSWWHVIILPRSLSGVLSLYADERGASFARISLAKSPGYLIVLPRSPEMSVVAAASGGETAAAEGLRTKCSQPRLLVARRCYFTMMSCTQDLLRRVL
jgi:hypothetical protein